MPAIAPDPCLSSYLVQNDPKAFERIVELHLPAVQGTARRILGTNSAWADDVAQEVFLMLIRKARTLPRNVVLSAWLHRQTVRRSIDLMRSETRRHKLEAAAGREHRFDSEGSVWNAIAPVVDQEILRLSDDDRQLLALRYMERCSSEEVGRRLGLTASAARKRLERALARLREHLEARCPVTLPSTAMAIYLGAPSAQAASPAVVIAISSKCLAASAASGAISGFFTTAIIMTKTHAVGITCTLLVGTGMFLAGRSTAPGLASTDASVLPSKSELISGNKRPADWKNAGRATRIPNTKQARLERLMLIMANQDAGERNAQFKRYVEDLDASLLPETYAFLASQGGLEKWSQGAAAPLMEILMSGWARRDPEAAMAALKGGKPGYLVSTVASGWASQDPDAAIAWLKSRGNLEDETRESGALRGVINGVASTDLVKATQLLEEVPSGTARQRALYDMLNYVTVKGTDETRVWVRSLSDDRLRKGAVNLVAENLLKTDPRAAADWLVGEGIQSNEYSSMKEVFTRWTRDDEAAALSYYSGLPLGDDRDRAAIGILGEIWTSPDKVGNFARQHPTDIKGRVFNWMSLALRGGAFEIDSSPDLYVQLYLADYPGKDEHLGHIVRGWKYGHRAHFEEFKNQHKELTFPDVEPEPGC
ncbi:RNA polymerase sigma factor [Luteolibacter flavescens]|uniref:RNA polymerase sigma factor n=1 Tax=Luteolibacter flavescens TaxID=1859460 RepID=A0ABT3FS22_9BACT|nr:RNA polymerase sigma factor [Luteolibacter flavescens]MCW1885994.1 RNA polymerase sigma factor [Luteolibacter flavescens]